MTLSGCALIKSHQFACNSKFGYIEEATGQSTHKDSVRTQQERRDGM